MAGLLLALAAIAAAAGHEMPGSSPSTAVSPPHHRHQGEHRAALGEDGGAVPDGTTVFDGDVAGVANLDPALLGALRRAASDATADGVELLVDSGWRSPEYPAAAGWPIDHGCPPAYADPAQDPRMRP